MRSRRKSTIVAAALLVSGLVATAPATGAGAADGQVKAKASYEAKPLAAKNRITTPKASTSRLAKSDPTLVASTSSARTAMVVKLDYDSLATYDGGIKGFPATSPAVTGAKLNAESAASNRYLRLVAGKEATFTKGLATASPSARIGTKLRTVYGGVSLVAPARDAARIAKLPGVLAVQRDSVRQPLTDASATFIGAPTVYDQLDETDHDAGKGVIYGVLDTGAWPEHVSFADQGNLSSPPERTDGEPRTCDFGDNPLTPGTDVFACNDKLIGGAPFLDTYNDLGGPELYPDSARDGNGHGSHTGSTSAGNYVDSAEVFGVERGPIHGIAPGAWVSVYKVCGTEGCFSSDSAAAVQAAITDGVSVINFSISGGANPLTDVVELSFLDAYQAGVFVSASAGNSGPGASTAEHLSPWVTTVGASTQTRAFQSTVTLADGGTTLNLVGASITAGVSAPTAVVQAANVAGYADKRCTSAPTTPIFAGKIVVCERGTNGRAEKGYNVEAGGAVGMLLYNPTTQDTETDNHFLPTVHLEGPQGAQMLAFLGAHPAATATFTAGTKANGVGDVMASFSSRGPGGPTIKPDVTAPGVQILAAHSPTPDEIAGGPEGEYFQAIAGTSMSSPHVAGSAVLLKALHPSWTPGQIKSALMTTAKTSVTKEDGTTHADAFDDGAGRIDLTKAGDPGLTISDSAVRMAALYGDGTHAIDMNIPSVDAPIMPGTVTTQRVVTNVTSGPLTFKATAGSQGAGSSITIVPSTFTVGPGRTANLTITIDAGRLDVGQYFGTIVLTQQGGTRKLHLPVAYYRTQGAVSVKTTCRPSTIGVERTTSACRVTAQNNAFANTTVQGTTTATTNLRISAVTGARRVDTRTVALPTTGLVGKTPAIPAIAPGASAGPGYLDLEEFGIDAVPIGDEEMVNFDVDPFVYGGESFSQIGISSNGYAVVGGGTAEDNNYEPQSFPDPSRPNNVLAAFWTDLNGDGAEGLRVALLSDDETGDAWLVVQYDTFLYGTTDAVATQIWIGLNGTEDISYSYDGAQPDPGASGLTVGAENIDGSGGDQVDGTQALAGDDLRVTTSGSKPGGSYTFQVNVRGVRKGDGFVKSLMTSPSVPGTTVSRGFVTVQ